jgi:hypothetical protein
MHSLLHLELVRARQAEILASRSYHGAARSTSPEQRQPRPATSRLRRLRTALARV